jgi:cellulose biosynthesis protein BcsQ
MLVACWSVKGGSGTTVVAAALALLMADAAQGPVLLVDLGGDAAAALGLPERGDGVGLADVWADTTADPAADGAALAPIVRPAAPGLELLSLGAFPAGRVAPPGAGDRLAAALSGWGAAVVDCGAAGPQGPALALAACSTISLLVLRPCYLALRRAVAAPLRPSGIVVVTERDRALRASDVEAVVGAPVRADVPWDPAVARAVDAGLLATRVPRALSRALRSAA